VTQILEERESNRVYRKSQKYVGRSRGNIGKDSEGDEEVSKQRMKESRNIEER